MLKTNEFYDINKFPKEPGITYFALSMPLLSSVQNPDECYKTDLHIISKIQASNVGAVVVYTDNLYMYSGEEAMSLKVKYQKVIENHKNGWMNLIRQNIYIIPSAFSFLTWNQLMLDCKNFNTYLNSFTEIYEKDEYLQTLIQMDIENTDRVVNKYTVGYMLEEILLDYLVVKGKVRLQNDYTKDKEEWVLNIYHGKPHRSYVYLCQKNLMNMDNSKNVYQNSWYDAKNKKLYDFDRLDIETFDFSK